MADIKTAVKLSPDEDRFRLEVVVFWIVVGLLGWWFYSSVETSATVPAETAIEGQYSAQNSKPDASGADPSSEMPTEQN